MIFCLKPHILRLAKFRFAAGLLPQLINVPVPPQYLLVSGFNTHNWKCAVNSLYQLPPIQRALRWRLLLDKLRRPQGQRSKELPGQIRVALECTHHIQFCHEHGVIVDVKPRVADKLFVVAQEQLYNSHLAVGDSKLDRRFLVCWVVQ